MTATAWTTAASFFFLQNQYFGWNAWPKSDAELICDGITMVIIALACICTVMEGKAP